LIAVTPEHLSRLLHELSRDGLLQLRRGSIVIPDPQALAAI
jgi:CRP-like cAMP-binding protein